MGKKLPNAAAFVAAFLLFGYAVFAHAQESPVGTWDFHIGGVNLGSAVFTFNDDFTLDGYSVTKPNPHPGPAAASTIVFGYLPFTGTWVYDPDKPNGIIGFFASVDEEEGDPEINASFKAKVRAGAKISMEAKSTNGPLRLSGVPAVPLEDISGTWAAKIGKKKEDEKEFTFITELFTLTPTILLNLYNLVGEGPDFTTTGVVLLSRDNRYGLVSEEFAPDEEEGPVRGLIGTVNLGKGKARLTGEDDQDNRFHMSATKCPTETLCLP